MYAALGMHTCSENMTFQAKTKKNIREWGKVIIGLATLKAQVVVGQAQAQAAVGYIILDELDARTTARVVQESSSNDVTDPTPSRYAHYNDGADPPLLVCTVQLFH